MCNIVWPMQRKWLSQREDQKHHLKQLNNKLETYLVAQHDQQEKIHDTLKHTAQTSTDNQPAALSPELSDYLYAQGILSQYQGTKDQADLTALDLAKTALKPEGDYESVSNLRAMLQVVCMQRGCKRYSAIALFNNQSFNSPPRDSYPIDATKPWYRYQFWRKSSKSWQVFQVAYGFAQS